MGEVAIKYEVIGRAIVRGKKCGHASEERHSLKLLYRGDGTPWWTCSAGLDLPIPPDFVAEPGDMVTLTLRSSSKEDGEG